MSVRPTTSFPLIQGTAWLILGNRVDPCYIKCSNVQRNRLLGLWLGDASIFPENGSFFLTK